MADTGTIAADGSRVARSTAESPDTHGPQSGEMSSARGFPGTPLGDSCLDSAMRTEGAPNGFFSPLLALDPQKKFSPRSLCPSGSCLTRAAGEQRGCGCTRSCSHCTRRVERVNVARTRDLPAPDHLERACGSERGKGGEICDLQAGRFRPFIHVFWAASAFPHNVCHEHANRTGSDRPAPRATSRTLLRSGGAAQSLAGSERGRGGKRSLGGTEEARWSPTNR